MTEQHDWAARWEDWRAQRWLDRRARLIEDIPTWRLVQELRHRGVLVAASDADLGRYESVGRPPSRAVPVDRDGLPLFRLLTETPTAGT